MYGLQYAKPIIDPNGLWGLTLDGGVMSLVVEVPIGAKGVRMVCADEYCRKNYPYFDLELEDAPDGTFVEKLADGSIGWQCKPEGRPDGPERTRWTEQDNLDNALGNAFSSFLLTFDAPDVGSSSSFTLIRRGKSFISFYDRGDKKLGRLDNSHSTRVKLVPVADVSAAAFLSRVMQLV